MNKKNRVKFIAATVLTLGCVAAIPAYAWFSNQRSLQLAAEVDAPLQLFITAVHDSDTARIDLGDIDIEKNPDDDNICRKDHVFCVNEIYYESYILQLAHTTNIPFTYKIFKAEYLGTSYNSSANATYFNKETDVTYYYKKTAIEIPLEPVNDDNGDMIADEKEKVDSLSYDPDDKIHKNARPLYLQGSVVRNSSEKYDYYILEVSWNKSQIDKTIFNNKETDVVYITAGIKES